MKNTQPSSENISYVFSKANIFFFFLNLLILSFCCLLTDDRKKLADVASQSSYEAVPVRNYAPHAMEMYGEVEVHLHASLTSVLRVPGNHWVRWLPDQVLTDEKLLLSPQIEHRFSNL